GPRSGLPTWTAEPSAATGKPGKAVNGRWVPSQGASRLFQCARTSTYPHLRIPRALLGEGCDPHERRRTGRAPRVAGVIGPARPGPHRRVRPMTVELRRWDRPGAVCHRCHLMGDLGWKPCPFRAGRKPCLVWSFLVGDVGPCMWTVAGHRITGRGMTEARTGRASQPVLILPVKSCRSRLDETPLKELTRWESATFGE